MIKAVVDVNVFVSVVLGGKISDTLYKDLEKGKFSLVLSLDIFNELLFVLSRPKFNFDEVNFAKVVRFLKHRAQFVEPKERLLVCRDPKDNKVLECAVAGNADFIITGDKDLLSLVAYKGISIVTPKQFMELLK